MADKAASFARLPAEQSSALGLRRSGGCGRHLHKLRALVAATGAGEATRLTGSLPITRLPLRLRDAYQRLILSPSRIRRHKDGLWNVEPHPTLVSCPRKTRRTWFSSLTNLSSKNLRFWFKTDWLFLICTWFLTHNQKWTWHPFFDNCYK